MYGDRKREKNKKDIAQSRERIGSLERNLHDLRGLLQKVASSNALHAELRSEVEAVLSEVSDCLVSL